MKKRNEVGNINEKALLNMKEVCVYTGLGYTMARKYIDEIGATRKFGGRVLASKEVIDKDIKGITN